MKLDGVYLGQVHRDEWCLFWLLPCDVLYGCMDLMFGCHFSVENKLKHHSFPFLPSRIPVILKDDHSRLQVLSLSSTSHLSPVHRKVNDMVVRCDLDDYKGPRRLPKDSVGNAGLWFIWDEANFTGFSKISPSSSHPHLYQRISADFN